ncbi:degt/dnrj/eryc1/strs aminotransferase [Lucifera butyrica]|uniref:Degt/dnrj/eryc1/strs aminotransferase n=1 Tax=Lucifera butyrica TaxID=1351585 RepID=A0A498R8R8_9FIRM|nr:UDP-4-amino-4,6-dideoxy-N-acetyl-beta-L-altrosamine transaminase [Lucifera butyrica]VBB05528.1 degt/dnrj/eryc1/strs aminotransferase [Lucifera butyrica]
MKPIPYGHQDINEADIQAVMAVLASDWITQGPAIEKFEQTVAQYCGARYAVAVNSATSALHIACMAAGLKRGEWLWTSPNTFVASANCGRYCGAAVDFADIDNRTYNISVTRLAEKLKRAKRENRLPKVVVPVHFAGQSCEMEPIQRLAAEYGFLLLEDASHAIGGTYQGQKVGSCRFADMTVFSFHPVKIITTAEGGMVLTNRQDLYERLIRLRSHGITRQAELMSENQGPWYYQQIELGFNYRLTDLQAALGISQMERIDEFVAKRRAIAAKYDRELKNLPLILPWQHPDSLSAYHLYVVQLAPVYQRKSRRQVFEELRASGIGVNVHYIPVHTQPYYRQFGFKYGDFPVAEAYYNSAVSIPLYAAMTAEQQDYVISTLTEILQ